MRVALTGATGLFGHGLAAAFRTRHEVFPFTHAEVDITDGEAVAAALERVQADLVVHAAAIPDLDICEAEPARAFLVNYHGTRHVVEAARRLGAGVAHISTDSVFDGKKLAPYVESDEPRPLTVYGRTKLRAEQAVESWPRHWIFRVSVLFGPGKINFVEKGIRKVAAGGEYQVASDQVGSATHTVDAGMKIMEVVESAPCGLYHLSNQGVCSRYELARRAVELAGLDPAQVVGVPDALMGRRAPRVKYAVMEMGALKRAGINLPRPWQEALAEYVAALKPSLVGLG